jgi:hypothetical protein
MVRYSTELQPQRQAFGKPNQLSALLLVQNLAGRGGFQEGIRLLVGEPVHVHGDRLQIICRLVQTLTKRVLMAVRRRRSAGEDEQRPGQDRH